MFWLYRLKITRSLNTTCPYTNERILFKYIEKVEASKVVKTWTTFQFSGIISLTKYLDPSFQ